MLDVLVIAVILLLIFGSKKLHSIGSDLGAAVKGIKKSMTHDGPAERRPPGRAGSGRPDADFPEVAAQPRSKRDGA